MNVLPVKIWSEIRYPYRRSGRSDWLSLHTTIVQLFKRDWQTWPSYHSNVGQENCVVALLPASERHTNFHTSTATAQVLPITYVFSDFCFARSWFSVAAQTSWSGNILHAPILRCPRVCLKGKMSYSLNFVKLCQGQFFVFLKGAEEH